MRALLRACRSWAERKTMWPWKPHTTGMAAQVRSRMGTPQYRRLAQAASWRTAMAWWMSARDGQPLVDS